MLLWQLYFCAVNTLFMLFKTQNVRQRVKMLTRLERPADIFAPSSILQLTVWSSGVKNPPISSLPPGGVHTAAASQTLCQTDKLITHPSASYSAVCVHAFENKWLRCIKKAEHGGQHSAKSLASGHCVCACVCLGGVLYWLDGVELFTFSG